MALPKQTIGVPFVQGLDLRTDEKLTQGMLELENASFETPGAIRKRRGFSPNSLVDTSGSVISDIKNIYAEDDDSALGHDGQQLYRFSGERWETVGDFDSNYITKKFIQRPTAAGYNDNLQSVYGTDVGVLGDYVGYIVLDEGAEVWAVIANKRTDSVLYADRLESSATATVPTVSVVPITDTEIAFLWMGGSNEILMAVYDFESFSMGSNVTLVAGASTTASGLTAKKFNSTKGILVYEDNLGLVNMARFSTTAVETTVTIAGSTQKNDSVPFIGMAANGSALVVYTTSTNVVRASGVDSSFTALNGGVPITVDTGGGIAPDAVVGIETSDNNFQLYWTDIGRQFTASSTVFDYDATRTATFDVVGFSAGSASDFVSHMIPSAEPFMYNDRHYIPMRHVPSLVDSDLGTHLLVNENALAVASFSLGAGRARSSSPEGYYSHVAPLGGGKFEYVYPELQFIYGESQDNVFYTASAVIDMEHTPRAVSLNEGVYFTGSSMSYYDGDLITETNFHYPPPLEVALDAGGALTSGATYQALAVYLWHDAFGRAHYSPPSRIATFTPSGANLSAQMVVGGYAASAKKRVQILYYMTDANGSVFRLKATDVNDDTSAQSEGLSPEPAADAPTVYTNGGVVANQQPLLSKSIAVRDDRMYSTDGDSVWFTKPLVDGLGAEFSASFTKQANQSGGEITAIAAMDANTVIFKEDSIQVFSGDGPALNGASNRFTSVRRISGDVGAVDKSPVVDTPGGVMFMSKKGIYLLNRSLQLDFIGAPVEFLKAKNLVSATIHLPLNEVRFGFSDAGLATYNYLTGTWSLSSDLNHAGTAALVDDDYWFCPKKGEVWVEGGELRKDDSDPYSLKISTPWLKLTGPSNWQRIYYVNVLGEFISPHTMNVEVYHDYSSKIDETITLSSDDLLKNDDGYFFRFKPKRQKSQAMRLVFYDTDQKGTGESYSISAIVLTAGVKQGGARLSPEKTV